MIKAVIFDCGGVLILKYNSKTAKNFDITKLMDMAGGEKLEADAFIGKISDKKLWDIIAENLGLTDETLKSIKNEHFDLRPLDKKIYNLALKLSQNYKTAILSNGIHDLFWHWSKKYKFKKAFKDIFVSADIRKIKPRADIYRYALKKMKLKPSEALFVDDLVENVEGARNVGISSFRYTGKNFSELKKWLIGHGVRA